jgi:hypothetical protein
VVPEALARHRHPQPIAPAAESSGKLLRQARRRIALSLREASEISRQIARALGDPRYFVAPGSLSDYEAVDQPPRHLHKILTLCVLYGLRFSDFLRCVGLQAENAGQEAMVEAVDPGPISRARPSSSAGAPAATSGFVQQLLARGGPVPFLLRRCLCGLAGCLRPHWNDFYWTGGDRLPLNPYLAGGLVILVNRRAKRPLHFRSRPLWQQPVYLLRRRDGAYLCACCSLEQGRLIVRPYPQSMGRAEQLRNQVEAEVVGQIVCVARIPLAVLALRSAPQSTVSAVEERPGGSARSSAS